MHNSPAQLLEGLVRETDEERSMLVARQLVECPDDALVPQLLQALNQESVPASAAAFVLAEWASQGVLSEDAVPRAVQGLTHDSAEVRQWCAAILRGIGPDARGATPPLLAALKDPDPGVRQSAVDALGKVAGNDEAALLHCLELLGDEEPVRNALVRLLGALTEVPAPVYSELKKQLRASSSQARAGAAAAASVLLHGRPTLIPLLVHCLGDSQPDVRTEAARALAELSAPERSVVLSLGKALRDPVASVRQEAARALDIFGEAAAPAVPYLVAVLKDPDGTVRFHAVEALEKLAPRQPVMLPAVVLALSNRLIDADVAVQTRALSAFSKLAPHAYPLSPNLQAAIHSPDPEVRLAAIEAVARIRHEGLQIRETLRKALRDRSGAVRVAAALALAKRNETGGDIVSTLIGALREPSARVQIAAIQALRALGRDATGAVQALEAKREDSNPDIRQLAELAIHSIAGHRLAESGA